MVLFLYKIFYNYKMKKISQKPQYLYRFRSIEKLLKYKELKNNEIYFSTLEELNDPVEGFVNIYWLGDEVLWKNFLKHFFSCFDIAFREHLQDDKKRKFTINVFECFHHYKDKSEKEVSEAKQFFEDMWQYFYEYSSLSKIIILLSKRKKRLSKNRLSTYLNMLTSIAFNSIVSFLKEKHNISVYSTFKPEDVKRLIDGVVYMIESDKRFEFIDNIETDTTMNIIPDFKNTFYLYRKEINLDLGLISLIHNFADTYLKDIERLLYPIYSVACFTKDMSQSNMWSHYADGHKGVCLKFNAQGVDSKRGLSLKINQNNNDIDAYFHKVVYSNRSYILNFFNSIKQLPTETYIEKWCRDKKGNYTKKKLGILSNKDEWQNHIEYNHNKIFTSKLKDWKHEQEYRLLMMISYNKDNVTIDRNIRKVKYNFSDLDGIIFGINTSKDDKIKILSVLNKKYIKEKHMDLKIYQAYCKNNIGRIECERISAFKSK